MALPCPMQLFNQIRASMFMLSSPVYLESCAKTIMMSLFLPCACSSSRVMIPSIELKYSSQLCEIYCPHVYIQKF